MRFRRPKSTNHRPKSTFGPQLKELYSQQYKAVLYAMLSASRGDSQLAQDITHDAFLRVMRTYEGAVLAAMSESERRAVLVRTANNLLIDIWRKDSKLEFWADCSDEALTRLDSVPDQQIEQILDNEALERFFDAAAEKLTAGEWRVTWMSWRMGKTDAEIAEEMGTTPKTVRSLRSSACKKLRACATREGAEITLSEAGTPTQRGSAPDAGEVTI